MTAREGRLVGGGIKQKGLMDTDNSVVIAGWGVNRIKWGEVEKGIRGISGNGKNTIKTIKKKHCWDYTLRTLKHQSKRTYVPQCS